MNEAKNILTITNRHNDGIVFEMDFQETDKEYRERRLKKLRARYPIGSFKFSWHDGSNEVDLAAKKEGEDGSE